MRLRNQTRTLPQVIQNAAISPIDPPPTSPPNIPLILRFSSNVPLWIFVLTCLFYCLYSILSTLREANAITTDLEDAEQAWARIREMEGGADLEGMAKKEGWDLRQMGLREGSRSSSRTRSLANGGKMEMEIIFEERRDRGGKMD